MKACGAPVAARGACPSWWCGGVLKSLETAGARSSTDRASDYGSEGWGFESLRAHHCSFAGRWFPPPGAGGGVPGYVVCPGTSPLCGAGVIRGAGCGAESGRAWGIAAIARWGSAPTCPPLAVPGVRCPLCVRDWQCQVKNGAKIDPGLPVADIRWVAVTWDCRSLTSRGWRRPEGAGSRRPLRWGWVGRARGRRRPPA